MAVVFDFSESAGLSVAFAAIQPLAPRREAAHGDRFQN